MTTTPIIGRRRLTPDSSADPLILVLGVQCGDCGRDSDGGRDSRGGPIDYPFLVHRSDIKEQAADPARWCPDCGGQIVITMEWAGASGAGRSPTPPRRPCSQIPQAASRAGGSRAA